MPNDERTVTISIPVPVMLSDFESLTRAALAAQGAAIGKSSRLFL